MKLCHLILVIALAAHSANCEFRCDVPHEWIVGNSSLNNFMPGTKWPNGVVKYEFDSSLTPGDRQEVQRAFADYHAKTCIRFQQRSPGEAAFVNIENDPGTCGLANVCRTGGKQFAKFGGNCRNWGTMVHELGHSLCFSHEQERKDRDDYLEYRNCKPDQLPPKDDFDLRGSLFDYGSCMHYGPCSGCSVGWAKQGDDIPCGHGGLSVMDADKFNDFYNCGGCFAHRWRPIDALSNADRRAMMKLGEGADGKPLYACRAMIRGEVSIAQVFTTPSQRRGNEGYQIITVNVNEIATHNDVLAKAIPAGRTKEGVKGFIALATITDSAKTERSVGKVYENNWGKAYFPFNGKEIEVRSGYKIVACG